MARWITDGSNGFTVDGNVVTLDDKDKKGNVFNAIWQEGGGVSSGKHYWKIHFPTLADTAGVGLTSINLFRRGHQCQAVYYFGSLSTGFWSEELLVGCFGPTPKEGDEIGILAVFEGDRLKVYIDVNERNLGLAFDVPSSIFNWIFPIVSFHTSGSATCTKQSTVPDDVGRTPVTFTGIEGDWKLVNLQTNGAPLDLRRCVSSNISKKEADKYIWLVRAVIKMRCNLSKVDGAWKMSPVESSIMLGPPKRMNVEHLLGGLMTSANRIDVDADGNLLVGNDQTSSTWTRFDPTFQPFVGNPFGIRIIT